MELCGQFHALDVGRKCPVPCDGLKNWSECGDEDSSSAATRFKPAVVRAVD